MPDKWAQYAVSGTPAQPQAAAPDPWAKYAVSGGQPTTTASNINNIPDQKPAGTLSNAWNALTQPETPGSIQRTGIAPVDNALTSIHNVGGRAISTMAAPIAHPIATLGGIFNMVAHPSPYDPSNPINQRVAEGVQDYQQSPRKAVENVAGDALGMYEGGRLAGGLAEKAAPAVSRLGDTMKDIGGRASNLALKTMPDQYGGDPGLAAARNGISGYTSKSILNATQRAIPQVNSLYKQTLGNYQGAPLNIGSAVTEPFNAVRAAKTNPVTGAAMPAQVAKLNKVQTLLTNQPDPATGLPSNAPRNLGSYSPLDANALKSSIYNMTDYESPFKNSLTNDALKQSSFGIKNAIQKAVPESVDIGDNLHNLMSLKTEMTGRPSGGVPTSKSGLFGNLAMKGGTQAGSGLYRVGESLPNLVSPQALATSALMPPFLRKRQR